MYLSTVGIFWLNLLGFMYKIISSDKKDTLTSSFPLNSFLIFLTFLSALAKTSNVILNRSKESEHSCLVPYLSVHILNFPPFRMMLVVGVL